MIYLRVTPLQRTGLVLRQMLLLIRGGRIFSDYLHVSAIAFLVLPLQLIVGIVEFLLCWLAVRIGVVRGVGRQWIGHLWSNMRVRQDMKRDLGVASLQVSL